MSKNWSDKSEWITNCPICYCSVSHQLRDYHIQYHEIKDKVMSIYDLSFIDNKGTKVEMSRFKDKVILLVNVASNCGFTKQYVGLEQLNKQYKDQGLAVIGFPCNQFGQQEPGSDSEIEEFCKTNYDVTFTMSTKIDVNGENAHPIYKYLTDKTGHGIAWNFQKFLIKNGEIVAQGAPDLPAISLEDQIKSIL